MPKEKRFSETLFSVMSYSGTALTSHEAERKTIEGLIETCKEVMTCPR